VVVVAGFQGLNPNEDIATLGRGGSDTTAVALAAAIKADRCQILKDVDGVFTTNPRVVPEARKLDEISYDEMLELASMGAEVLQSRAVEFAKKYGVVLEVMSSFHENPGTLVREEVKRHGRHCGTGRGGGQEPGQGDGGRRWPTSRAWPRACSRNWPRPTSTWT
jgi:aspartate kinase